MAEADGLWGVLEFGVDGLGDPAETNSTDIVAALRCLGFAHVSQRGSHVKLNKAGRVVIVPMHRELAAGMVRIGSIAATKASTGFESRP